MLPAAKELFNAWALPELTGMPVLADNVMAGPFRLPVRDCGFTTLSTILRGWFSRFERRESTDSQSHLSPRSSTTTLRPSGPRGSTSCSPPCRWVPCASMRAATAAMRALTAAMTAGSWSSRASTFRLADVPAMLPLACFRCIHASNWLSSMSASTGTVLASTPSHLSAGGTAPCSDSNCACSSKNSCSTLPKAEMSAVPRARSATSSSSSPMSPSSYCNATCSKRWSITSSVSRRSHRSSRQ
mmetsp:Transcript_25817/g.70028  ORF Transcript_25817/g.70028 Transcript_25817/m.70028 type:complete len:243 (+) Transcript_25817:514-1242(+)